MLVVPNIKKLRNAANRFEISVTWFAMPELGSAFFFAKPLAKPIPAAALETGLWLDKKQETCQLEAGFFMP